LIDDARSGVVLGTKAALDRASFMCPGAGVLTVYALVDVAGVLKPAVRAVGVGAGAGVGAGGQGLVAV
jgi:hypothetical protein